MKQKKLVRFELLLLAVVTLLLAYRMIEGPPAPAGVVVLDDIERGELRREAFSTDVPVRVSIDAVGSFESADGDTSLAAYAWLLRRQDRKVVWRLSPMAAQREGETLAAMSDTVELSPGIYDAYFTSHGSRRSGGFNFRFLDRLFGNDASWMSEADDWQFVVRAADGGEGQIHPIDTESEAELSPGGDGLFWSTAPMKGGRRAEHVFLATEKIPVRIYAVGEIDDEPMDYGWIEDAVSGTRTWEMTLANTVPAGGWHVNRLFDDSIFVEEGIHRAVFRTDARQNFDDWVANPPYDPAAWGMSLFTSMPDAIREYDPWATRTPVVEIKEVGDDERHTAQFRVVRPVQLAAWSVGEMSSSSRYDYAWIRNNDTQETVWEMSVERSSPAGGDNNYRELAFLNLAEGTYTLTYQTDDSHSFDSWRHGRPDHPERWGVSLFPVAADFDTSAVELLDYSEESLDGDEPDRADAPPAPPLPDLPDLPGRTVVDLTALGNQQQVSKEFVLEQPATLHIRAIGEVSLSGRYDYGWIERTDNGEIVWEMSWQNTRAAGGDDINRLFDGTVTLEPGTYVAHFKTDFSHAYGDFGERAPSMSNAWGIQISKL